VLVVGYAAAGTRARLLVDCAPEIKIHGRYVPVKADVEAFSAHTDCDELVAWATAGTRPVSGAGRR
jgi:metallo-beta-lactamase family protein